MKAHRFIFSCLLVLFGVAAKAQYGTLAPLHVSGNQLQDTHGNPVLLHGVMDTPNPYFNNNRWGDQCNRNMVTPCINYFDKLFTAITDTAQGTWCNVFRLHLDPAWTNQGAASGENDISKFSPTRLHNYLNWLYMPIMEKALAHGLYVVVRPPGVCPENVQVGDDYQRYLLQVWDSVTNNATFMAHQGEVMIELANEPVNVKDASGQANTATSLHDYFQPIVDLIRQKGYTGVIWVPGYGYQSQYGPYATHPITGYNIGYAVHVYPGWYNTDNSTDYTADSFLQQFLQQVPVAKTNPIIVTEIDWSPEKVGEGHYNEFGQWVPANYGTWGTATTRRWGAAWKHVMDACGNISMTLAGTGDYINIDKYLADGTVTRAFAATDDACDSACWAWYAQYATTHQPRPAYTRTRTADQGDGTYINPLINADFPDPDVIRVGDTYYMASTTMFHTPGATLLKSADLVNWEYCNNVIDEYANTDAFNLANGSNAYAQGMWAPTLRYHKGTFYYAFLCLGLGKYIIMTATHPEGKWTKHVYDTGWYDASLLFDGDDTYIVSGINTLTVTRLDDKFNAIESKVVVERPDRGLEGSHFYHIGNYYYIYATYGGNDGSQTIFRSSTPMGTYTECPTLLMEGQKIHQGTLVDTPTGEWWTILFKDAGAIGRVPYLEPVIWSGGWPTIGNNGTDVSAGGTAHKKPDTGTPSAPASLPTNDTFTDPTLGMQWEWNHQTESRNYSLFDNPGNLRLYTASVVKGDGLADNIGRGLMQAQGSLTQRIFGYDNVGTPNGAMKQAYGTIKLSTAHMKDGDYTGISVFQEPYCTFGVVQRDGKRMLEFYRSAVDNTQERSTNLGVTVDDVVYLRTVVDWGQNRVFVEYSFDNAHWTRPSLSMSMGYHVSVFVGNRFYLFNYATKQTGGYVDIDWFSTEPVFSEDRYFAPGTLKTFSEDDLTMADLTFERAPIRLKPGASQEVHVTCTSVSGLANDVSSACQLTLDGDSTLSLTGNVITATAVGAGTLTATYADRMGNTRTINTAVESEYFPLTSDQVNTSLRGNGAFDEATGLITPTAYGLVGWQYAEGIDISRYTYLNVLLNEVPESGMQLWIFDTDNLSGDHYTVDLATGKELRNGITPATDWTSGEKEYSIKLSDMHIARKTLCDPTHIHCVAFYGKGGAVSVGKVWVANDTTTGITEVSGDTSGMTTTNVYNLAGQRVSDTYKGIVISNGKKHIRK